MLTKLLFFFIVFLIIWRLMKKPFRFPPGPPRWPLIGNLPELNFGGLPPHEAIGHLAHKYGEVVGFYLGRAPVILVSGVEAIREALNKPELQGRPTSAVNRLEHRKLGVVFTDNDFWREQRRFSLRHLKELGMGKREMESVIHEEIRDMMEEVKRYVGPDWSKPVPVRELVAASGANVIYHMLAGERFELRDPRLRKLMNVIRNLTSLVNASGGLAGSMPILLRILPQFTEYPQALKYRKELYEFLTEKIEEHKKRLDEDNPSDFIDMFLLEMKKQDAHPSFHMEQLLYLCTDLFIAGSDTTSGTLSIALLYMVLCPDVQAKVQKELDEVVGKERLPSLNDKAKLRYSDATLSEVYRISSVDPLAVPHAVLNEENDVEFRGFVIPKNARILINLYGMHMDKKYWGDPNKFRPERFLDSQGNLKREDALIPFGIGKRSCIGESMARNNIFLTFTSLMQNYSIRIPEGDPKPSSAPDGGLVLCAKPFKVVMKPRTV